MLSKIYLFFASFFWGNWFFRVVQTALFGVIVIFAYLSLFSLSTVRQGELGVLAAAPLIFFFLPGLLVNVALIFGLRKAKNSKNNGTKTLFVSLSLLSIFIAVFLFVLFRVLL